MASESHIKLMAYLESEEGKESIVQFFKERQEKEDLLISYFETPEFFIELEKVKKWMIDSKIYSISDDDYTFPPHSTRLPIYDESFDRLTNCILKSLESEEKTDEDNPFSNGYVTYKEWTVKWISGQGSISTLVLNKDIVRDDIISSIID